MELRSCSEVDDPGIISIDHALELKKIKMYWTTVKGQEKNM